MYEEGNVIKKEDYEHYEVLLPFKSALGNAKRRFIYSELEKLHPCFSDEFCVDENVRRITKKGICSDVFVMHKFKLAEYENSKHFSGSGFFLADEKKKRFFICRKIRMLLGFFLILAVLSVAGGAVWIGKKCNEKKSSGEEILETEIGTSLENGTSDVTGNQQEGEREKSDERTFAGCAFLDAVYESKGKINDFRWSTDFYSETVEGDVEGIFPEQLESIFPGIKVPSAKYKNGIPCLSFKNTSKFYSSDFDKTIKSRSLDFLMIQKEVRNLIVQDGAVLIEESQKPYRVFFHCDAGGFSKVINALADYINENFIPATEIHLTLSEKSGFDLSLVFQDEVPFFSGLPLAFLVNKIGIKEKTESHQNEIVRSEKYEKQKAPAKDVLKEFPGGKKIGEIRRAVSDGIEADGSVRTICTVFYKLPDGKVIQKQEIIQ